MAPHELSRSATACHTARVRLSRDQKASTAPPKPQKCKESSAPSYTVISTRYGSAIHVFLTYSNALSFSGTSFAPLLLRPNAFADHPTKSVSRTASHSHLGGRVPLPFFNTICDQGDVSVAPKGSTNTTVVCGQSSEAFRTARSWLFGMVETQGTLVDASQLTWGSAGPYGDPTPASCRKPKRGVLSLDAAVFAQGIDFRICRIYDDAQFWYQKWAARANFRGPALYST